MVLGLLLSSMLWGPSSTWATVRILALGDSLTEGYGVEKDEAYPFLLEQALRDRGHDVEVVNAGISGSTSASALGRLKWYLRAKPDILILALGANDGLRGLSVAKMQQNLEQTIDLAQSRGMKVLLAGMQMPLNYGPEYTASFREAFPEVAERRQVALIPFLLEGVGGIPEMNIADGIHPNPQGHQVITQTVLQHLEPLLN
jgi:acyl-CoA thioesterase-1